MSVNNFLQKSGFSLIELLIVVIIIGVVYTLSITKLQNVGEKSHHISLQTLKPFLLSQKYKENARILCLDDCSECKIFLDNKVENKLTKRFHNFLDESVEVFTYEQLDGFKEFEFDPFFNAEGIEEKVCFSYSVDRNGIGEQLFVRFQEKVYDFTTYFEKTKIYNSLDEIVEKKENLYQEVLR